MKLRAYKNRLYAIPGFKVIFELIFVILPIAFLIRTVGFGLYQVPTGSMETTLLVGERFFADKLSYWFRKPDYGEIIAFNEPQYTYSKKYLTNLWERYASWNISNWTKRVLGKPGDTIKGAIEEGKPVIYRNGKKLDEPYVNKYPIIAVWEGNPRYASPFSLVKRTKKSFDPQFSFDSSSQPFYKIDPDYICLDSEGNPEILYPGTPRNIDVFEIKLGENQYWVQGDNRLGSYDCREWGHPLDGNLIHGRIVFCILSIDSDEPWLLLDILKNPISFWQKVRWSRCLRFVK